MSVPRKYLAIGDFHEYYSGNRVAPVLTIFIGGNHEASSYLQELSYGGWVAPNIYYLGAANVVRIGGLRIAGLSGIWKGYNYNKPHFERLPYSADEIKSLYHVREIDTRKLLLIKTQVDVGISHDWPRGIEWKGNHRALFRAKDQFESDAKAGMLGSTAASYVMRRLRPRHWFSAHLHCRYAATETFEEQKAVTPPSNQVQSEPTTNIAVSARNENEIELDLDEEEFESMDPSSAKDKENKDSVPAEEPVLPHTDHSSQQIHMTAAASADTSLASIRAQLPASFNRPSSENEKKVPRPPPAGITNTTTEFLALDKCLPSRKFLELLEINTEGSSGLTRDPPRLQYDVEWLAILRTFALHDPHQPFPADEGEDVYEPMIEAEANWVQANLAQSNRMDIPENFQPTAPFFDGGDIHSVGNEQPREYSDPQTKAFCELLNIPNWFDDSEEVRENRRKAKSLQIEAELHAESTSGGRFGGGRGRGRGFDRGGRRGGGRGGRGGGRGKAGRYH